MPTPGTWAIVVARYNESVTRNLLRGALDTLAEHGVEDEAVTVVWVPGAWEVPLPAARLARSGQFQRRDLPGRGDPRRNDPRSVH